MELVGAVAELLRTTAEQVVLPLFGTAAADPRQKRPGDWVTVADQRAEELLTERLPRLLPGSRVVGEEAVHHDPSLLGLLDAAGAVWVVDPVDGTRNYAAGRGPFAMMVALVQDGNVIHGWVYLPVEDRMLTASSTEAGLSDGPVAAPPQRRIRGVVPLPALRPEVARDIEARPGFDLLPSGMCAGFEYHQLMSGEADFALFATSLPWDHAAGSLAVTASGGMSAYFDAEPYTVRDRNRRPLLVARSPAIWRSVRDDLLPSVAADPERAWVRR